MHAEFGRFNPGPMHAALSPNSPLVVPYLGCRVMCCRHVTSYLAVSRPAATHLGMYVPYSRLQRCFVVAPETRWRHGQVSVLAPSFHACNKLTNCVVPRLPVAHGTHAKRTGTSSEGPLGRKVPSLLALHKVPCTVKNPLLPPKIHPRPSRAPSQASITTSYLCQQGQTAQSRNQNPPPTDTRFTTKYQYRTYLLPPATLTDSAATCLASPFACHPDQPTTTHIHIHQ